MNIPITMDGLEYFSQRKVDKAGQVGTGSKLRCWIPKQKCAKCGELLGKPIKNGELRMLSQCVVCKNGHAKGIVEHKKTRIANMVYQCPHCASLGKASFDAKWQLYDFGKAFTIKCHGCQKDIYLTKKLVNVSKTPARKESTSPIQKVCPKCQSINIDYKLDEMGSELTCFSCGYSVKGADRMAGH